MSDPIINVDLDELPPELISQLTNGLSLEGIVMINWIRQQRDKLQRDFMAQVRIGLENGESTAQITTRMVGGTVQGVPVPGVMKGARRNAETLVRTAVNEIVTNARVAQLESMDVVKHLQQISTLDSRTSDVCIAYSGQVWDKETKKPVPPSTLPWNGGTPRHFNCRSTIVPVLKSWDELGFDLPELPPGQRASMDGFVPGDITFDKWLRGKGKTFQNELLGPARANLWRSGKITLTQLVDMRGNPLTLDQLADIIGP